MLMPVVAQCWLPGTDIMSAGHFATREKRMAPLEPSYSQVTCPMCPQYMWALGHLVVLIINSVPITMSASIEPGLILPIWPDVYPARLDAPFEWVLAGPTPFKVMQSTGSSSRLPGEPWQGHWPCRDQGVIPMGLAGAVRLVRLCYPGCFKTHDQSAQKLRHRSALNAMPLAARTSR